jgi:hypothetical protein
MQQLDGYFFTKGEIGIIFCFRQQYPHCALIKPCLGFALVISVLPDNLSATPPGVAT